VMWAAQDWRHRNCPTAAAASPFNVDGIMAGMMATIDTAQTCAIPDRLD
jgi:hypothetical protein